MNVSKRDIMDIAFGGGMGGRGMAVPESDGKEEGGEYVEGMKCPKCGARFKMVEDEAPEEAGTQEEGVVE